MAGTFISEPFLRSLVIGIILIDISVSAPNLVKAAPMPLTGYAWSSEMGWISFSGSTYGVSEESTNGNLSGYAWSSNLGWISFEASHVSGCPTGPCAPRVDSSGEVRGWARACAAFTDKLNCSGPLDPNAGGWDGFIALKGTAQDGSSYGVTQDASCNWSGFAWGSDALGAISMRGIAADGSSYSVSCTLVPPTATLSANPATINSGDSSTLSWSSTDATSCVAAGGFSTGGNTSGSDSTGPLSATQNYAVTCTGPGGSDTANATVTVSSPPSTVSLDAAPDRVRNGGTTRVTWSGSGVNACHIDRNGVNNWQTLPGGATQTISGFADDVVTERTVYVLTCNTGATATKVVNLLPSFEEF